MYNDGEGSAGVLLCSLTGMVKIHQSDSCLKVQVPWPWLDKRRVSSRSILFKVPGCTNSSLGSILCHDLEKGVSIHTLNITITSQNLNPHPFFSLVI